MWHDVATVERRHWGGLRLEERAADNKAVKPFAAAAILAVPIFVGAQQQGARPRGNWPCRARIDPSYFRVAEGTGGHLLLLAPEEIADSATLLTALEGHPQTLLRLAGSLTPGLHEFQVPVDPSVESVLFSISVQCLQVADIVRPSGAAPRPARGGPPSGDHAGR